MIKKILLFTIAAFTVIFTGFIILGVFVAGDRFCTIELQNSKKETLSIKTVKSEDHGWTMTVDSLTLEPMGKFEIGECINGIVHETSFYFEAIVIFEASGNSKLIHRKDLPDYLNSLQRSGCGTFEVR